MRVGGLWVEFGIHHLLNLLDLRLVRWWQYWLEELRPLLDLDPFHLVGAVGRGYARPSIHVAIQFIEALPSDCKRFPRIWNHAEVTRLVEVISIVMTIAQVLLRSENVTALAEHLTLLKMIISFRVRRRAERVSCFWFDRRWWRSRLWYARLTEKKQITF
ncbi:hypothetical protein PUN28_019135 [Cardiocondyla obscurior]|uniref:Uncharacterized protein n=1 Tax=Cardiocondyla obscurior TaxID=286306 RepID=A0AAW2EFL8_9HYME